MQPSVELTCPAKVNLALSVGSPRPGGMHPLASWMVAVGFGDSLKIKQTDEPCRFDIAPAPPATEGGQPQVIVDWPIEKDLVYRAWSLIQERVGRPLQVLLTLRKRIPTGAGLGGGSSNAAGTLVGLNRLFSLGMERAELIELGASLGSDVGFLVAAILGQPSALVAGLGEQIEPLTLPSPVHLVLVFPALACPTGDVYRAFDRLPGQAGVSREPETQRVRDLAQQQPLAADGPFNDLAQAAMAVRSELRGHRDKLQQDLQHPIHVTGSGSTLFAVAPDAQVCQVMAKRVAAISGLPAIATAAAH